MSDDMSSGCSDDSDVEDYQYEIEDIDLDQEPGLCKRVDPEYFDFQLLSSVDVERLLNEKVEALCTHIDKPPSLAKVLLHRQAWDVNTVVGLYKTDYRALLAECRIEPLVKAKDLWQSRDHSCPVCLQSSRPDQLKGLSCGHKFCTDCWQMHFQIQIKTGQATGLECMGKDCNILAPEDFVLNTVASGEVRDKYQEYVFRDHVQSNPELRFCPGPNCELIVRAPVPAAKRVICEKCSTQYCFKCGLEYHAPTQCDVIKKWLVKCADDSETANYISAHTKDCPKCHVCIEKNGGCNHVQCAKCQHNFCWMCLGDWKSHGSEYYECSKYKENPNIANESVHAQAREALKKYLFYFERWENHAKSLRLEEETSEKLKKRNREKVLAKSGTWIDWQYLLDAAELLKKCRYTLQYTYPYAYYLNSCKSLFEYQQAQLEAEVENLSWKVERAEITDRGDLENQMDIAEKRRLTLIEEFLHNRKH